VGLVGVVVVVVVEDGVELLLHAETARDATTVPATRQR
jgi:hypothetical protein